LCTAFGPDAVEEVAAEVRDEEEDVDEDEVDEVVLVVEVVEETVLLLVGYAPELVG
jgi:hypothetical protein